VSTGPGEQGVSSIFDHTARLAHGLRSKRL